jgi:hypothetical protein
MAVMTKHGGAWLSATFQHVKVRSNEFSQEPQAVETLKYTRRRRAVELVAVKIPAYHRPGRRHSQLSVSTLFSV